MALAAPLPSPALEGGRDEAKEGVREGEGPKPSRASLSHVMLMGHACLYGAITALGGTKGGGAKALLARAGTAPRAAMAALVRAVLPGVDARGGGGQVDEG
eukprot:277529-Rhodomonas_salina.1